jgi:hypothetical protein
VFTAIRKISLKVIVIKFQHYFHRGAEGICQESSTQLDKINPQKKKLDENKQNSPTISSRGESSASLHSRRNARTTRRTKCWKRECWASTTLHSSSETSERRCTNSSICWSEPPLLDKFEAGLLLDDAIFTIPPYRHMPIPPESFHSWYPLRQSMQSTTFIDEPPYSVGGIQIG